MAKKGDGTKVHVDVTTNEAIALLKSHQLPDDHKESQDEKKAFSNYIEVLNQVVLPNRNVICRTEQDAIDYEAFQNYKQMQNPINAPVLDPKGVLRLTQHLCCTGNGCSFCKFRWYPATNFTSEKGLVENYRENRNKDDCILREVDWLFLPQFHRLDIFDRLGVDPCRCQQCSDVTDGGLYYQAFPCKLCPSENEAFIVPQNPYDKNSEWNCTACKNNVHEADQVRSYYRLLYSHLSKIQHAPFESLRWITFACKKRAIHPSNFIFFYAFYHILMRLIKLDIWNPLFYQREYCPDLNAFRTQLCRSATQFLEVLKTIVPYAYCNYFSIPERFASVLELRTICQSVRGGQLTSFEKLDDMVKLLYFRDVVVPLMAKPLTPLMTYDRKQLRAFERHVIHALETVLIDLKRVSVSRIPPFVVRLLHMNGLQPGRSFVSDDMIWDMPKEALPNQFLTQTYHSGQKCLLLTGKRDTDLNELKRVKDGVEALLSLHKGTAD